MIVDSCALTNHFLRSSRTLLQCAQQATDERVHRTLLAASLAALDQAVCAWIAEIVADSAEQRTAMVAVGHFPTVLSGLDALTDAVPTAELEELRLSRRQPASALSELEMVRYRDLQPPQQISRPQLIGSDDRPKVTDIERWQLDIENLIESGRQTTNEW